MRKSLWNGELRRRWLTALTLGCVLSFTSPVPAVDITWEGDETLDWGTIGNWDVGALPTLDDDAFINNGQTVDLNSDVGDANNVFVSADSTVALSTGGALNVINDFLVGSEADSPAGLTQSGGDLAIGRFLTIGDFADGSFELSGGTTTIGAVGTGGALLAGVTVNSTITVSGGELRQADVDADNSDSFNFLGLGPGGAATVELSGGTISTFATIYVGGDGGATAVVNQTGGLFQVRERSMRLGGFGEEAAPTSGTYNISGGTLATGTGLSIGYGSFATGVVNVSDAADVQVGGTIFMGLSDDINPGHGEINQSGGTVVTGVLHDPDNNDVGQDLLVGYGDESSAAYNLSGGLLAVPGFAILGVRGSTDSEMTVSGDDTVFQTGGDGQAFEVGGETTEDDTDPTFAKPTFGHMIQNGGAVVVEGQLQIASGAAAVGVYDLNDGVLDVARPTLMSGAPATEFTPGELSSGDSTFNQSGGESVFRDILLVGFHGKGEVNLTGGAMTVASPDATDALIVGIFEVADGTKLNVSGGDLVSLDRVRVADGTVKDAEVNVSGDANVLFGGVLLLGGGVDEGSGTGNNGVFNQTGGVVQIGSFNLIAAGGSANPAERSQGTYNISGGQLNLMDQTAVGLSGTGAIHQSGGTVNSVESIFLAVDPGSEGTYELSGGTLNLNRQGIFIDEGDGSFEFTGGRLHGAALVDFTLTQTGGVISTGDVADGTEISGDYFLSGGAAVEIKLGGLIPISEYDLFQVDGVAHLGGSLNVVLINDFSPQLGDEFAVLTSLGGNIVGEFADLVFPDLPGLTGKLFYEPDAVILRIVEPGAAVPGDTDDDGDVDLTDLNNVRNNFGAADPVIGDTDNDGDVDLSDLNAVRNNFGVSGGSPTDGTQSSNVGGKALNYTFDGLPDFGDEFHHSVSDKYQAELLYGGKLAGANAVPEPSTWTLGFLASLGGLLVARRRRG